MTKKELLDLLSDVGDEDQIEFSNDGWYSMRASNIDLNPDAGIYTMYFEQI